MKTIDIRTTQNVTIEYELASLRERLLAFFIDLVIVYMAVLIIFFIFLSGFTDAFLAIGGYGLQGTFASFVLSGNMPDLKDLSTDLS